MFSLEFNEQMWMCHFFLLFLFFWTILAVLHKVINIWSRDYSEFAISHVLTDCSVPCSSKRVRYPAQNVGRIVCGISLLVVL